jgi:D-alanine-D-alanine ligase
LNIC